MSEHPASAVLPRKRGWRRVAWMALTLGLGLAAGAGLGYQYALGPGRPGQMVMLTEEQVQAQDASLRQREAEARFLRAQLDTADGEIAVERAARQELETQLRASQAEVGRVRDQLAFYEQLLPPGPAGSIDIRGAEFSRVGSGLRYRVLLMRSGRGGESAFSGELRFQANGIQQGQMVTVELSPQQVKTDEAAAPAAVLPPAAAQAVPAEEAPAATVANGANGGNGTGLLALNFDQFQRSQGVLALPEGFVPESVTVTVLEEGTVRATRNVKLEF
ncbi:DUF6776 family protein [Bordetella pseudohinzii]|uniref:Uncharacterized protein n=1 Tax=Bordetella pseudohinzii TaxID=1331258 RepID=A0A0J6BVX5_9BORD|nr:DUF6776 family protein [Bordetella pseudohinzii]ANY14901.1 hypothetical protein BBN53_02720 [Bordetella pseudohinzii]KMM25929.1 membrane protein [Bordetella pseudohinzii]KXA76469.1 hypothetical protein AW878_17880 [Bordetella pseudohinzii]KXA79304.1 hypothetical protein AW877_09930 [Bordetella pseudohinzii]CUI94499.1 Uncharacterised protein [Bordetella pseudohinzii]